MVNAPLSLAAPSADLWMGADVMGRDLYSRIIYGARISLAVGIGSTILGCTLGVIVGLASGYLGGWFDLLMQRIMDIMQALPLLVLALVSALLTFIVVKLGPRLGTAAELLAAFTRRGHWYLMPLVVVLVTIGSLLVVAASSPLVAPFIYTLF